MGWLQQAWVKKAVHGMEAYRLSGKEKVMSAAVSKECHTDSIVGIYWITFIWWYMKVEFSKEL